MDTMKRTQLLNRKTIFLVTLLSIVVASILIIRKTKMYENAVIKYRYGPTLNETRRKVGLCEFRKNWVIFSADTSGFIIWTDPKIDSIDLKVKSFYYDKMMSIVNDKVVTESDVFINPEIMDTSNNTHIFLIYTYCFEPDSYHHAGWSYFFNAKYTDDKRGDISKQEADSILKSWGLRYPM